jgi:hypothetical protein
MFGLFKKKSNQAPPAAPPERFPPVPAWRPVVAQPIDRLVERIRHYSNGTKDFAVFRHGTVAILPDGLSDDQASQHALQALHGVFHAHPDMNPRSMKDGNILIQYNNDVVSVVLDDLVEANWEEIDAKHQDALATHEVLITPLGHNKFDAHGKKALFGRCYMFMDAQDPLVVRIERRAT